MPDAVSAPPAAPKKPTTITLHGLTRTDEYAWLKDENWQQAMRDPDKLDPNIRAYLEAENAYTKALLAETEELQTLLFDEMKGRIKEDDSSVPAPDGEFEYFTRYETGGQHPLFCRRSTGDTGDGEVLLHGDKEAEGLSFFRVGGCVHSTDHARLAYALDTNGSEIFTVKIRDLASGGDLNDRIPDCSGNIVWGNDGETLYYTVLDDNHRPYRVNRHRVGTEAGDDVTVYEETDPGFFVGAGKSQSGKFVEISAHDHTTSEVHLIDADDPNAGPAVIAPRDRNVEYDIAHVGDKLFIRTNADDAVDFKIVEAPLSLPGRENWTDVIPHEPGRFIRSILEFGGYLVRHERIDGLPRIVVRELASGSEHAIAFDEEAYELGMIPGYEFNTDILRFTYSSMTTPRRTFDYRMGDRARELRKEQEVPSGHRAGDYVTRRIFAERPDGARVPISILHARDTPLDGSAPALLYGYGSYGMSMPASFSTNRLSLVDRGFVYAIAHIRGGTERGYQWYLDGKLTKKKNTFEDFVAAGEKLTEEGFSAAGRIAIHGGSAGGMLVGASANMRPDLWGAVVGEVPFVDVLNTMCDKDLPLTPPEWPEWGNPLESKEAHDYIASYSPYDNVEAKDYPPIFVTAGISDPRVTYWEPAKWVARLRELKTDDNPLMLRTNMEAGHAGAAGRFDRLDEVAMVYAFLLSVLGRA